MNNMEMRAFVERSMTFADYWALIEQLVSEGRTTGPDQSQKRVEFTVLNRQRMYRLAKTVSIEPEIAQHLENVKQPQIWLVITEAWCGDAAQNIPVIEKIAAESDRIETRYILRDENPELMDAFLTDGARAIPKLIALDAETYEAIGTWGSRPRVAQDLYLARKEAGVEPAQIKEELQRWYNADKGRSLQREFVELIGLWTDKNVEPLSGGLPPAERAITATIALR